MKNQATATVTEPAPKPSYEELQAQLAEAQKKLDAKSNPALTMKVAVNSGALSIYGLQRVPVTLYAGQWERIAAFMPEILKFIKENKNSLKRKE